MPKEETTSSVLKKFGKRLNKGFLKHKSDETKAPAVRRLPGGINNGVAQLVDIKFGTYESGDYKDKPFFSARGICLLPLTAFDKETNTEIPTRGLSTYISSALCDTPKRSRKTEEENIAWVINQVRLLGVDTDSMESIEELEAVFDTLKEEKPCFSFSTRGSKATKDFDASVFHNWGEVVEEPDEVDLDEVEDKSATNGEATAEEEEASPDDIDPPADADEEETDEEETADKTEEEVGPELDALAEAADSKDKDAAKQLKTLAKEAGLSDKEISAADNWAAVAELIREKTGDAETETAEEGEEEPEAEGDEFTPKLRYVYKYAVIDSATKKPVIDKKTKKPAPPVEVQITAINEKRKTVSARNVDTKEVYTNVPWDKLIGE